MRGHRAPRAGGSKGGDGLCVSSAARCVARKIGRISCFTAAPMRFGCAIAVACISELAIPPPAARGATGRWDLFMVKKAARSMVGQVVEQWEVDMKVRKVCEVALLGLGFLVVAGFLPTVA